MTTPKTKRQQLGELITFLRTEQNMSRHNLADKTRATVKDVERWERGELCPTTQEWQRMRACYPQLTAARYKELHGGAALEQLGSTIPAKAEPGPEPDAPSELDVALQLLLEAVPALRSLTIEVADDGEVSVNYKTREVRVIEDSGHMTLARKQVR